VLLNQHNGLKSGCDSVQMMIAATSGEGNAYLRNGNGAKTDKDATTRQQLPCDEDAKRNAELPVSDR
jgi:hypothetical protein